MCLLIELYLFISGRKKYIEQFLYFPRDRPPCTDTDCTLSNLNITDLLIL